MDPIEAGGSLLQLGIRFGFLARSSNTDLFDHLPQSTARVEENTNDFTDAPQVWPAELLDSSESVSQIYMPGTRYSVEF